MTSFNIDQWLSGEEGTRVKDALASVEAEHQFSRWSQTNNGWQSQCRCGQVVEALVWNLDGVEVQREHRAEESLRAALSLTTTCANPKCDNGYVPASVDEMSGQALNDGGYACSEFVKSCPDCKGGTVPGEPLVFVREQRELIAYVYTAPDGIELVLRPEDVKRAYRPLEKEDET